MNKRIPSLDEFINESKAGKDFELKDIKPEISLPTYESFNSEESIFEAENLSYKGETYEASYNKNKSHDGVSYDLILKNTGTGEFLVFPRVFTYKEGWSQGTGRSERGYYLNTYGYGSRGNGSGQRSPSAPYYINQEFEYIMDCYTGKHYNKDNVKWYQNNAITFLKGTKIADIKKELKYR